MEQRRADALAQIQHLRDRGYRVDYPLTATKVPKQFQAAEDVDASLALLYGDEWPQVKVKKLATREESLIAHDALLDSVPLEDGSQTEDQIYLTQILHQLAALGEGMKETALLVHAEGMSHAEAGAVLGVSESTISWRVHTIRKHMGRREARVSESV